MIDTRRAAFPERFAAATGSRTPSTIPWVPMLREGWPQAPLRYVARLGTGHTPSRQHPEWWIDCNIPWLTTADVHKFRDDEIEVLESTEHLVSAVGLANSAAVLHPARTVALSRTASVGFSVIMGRDMATSQDFVTWTCSSRLLPEFLLYCLRAMRADLLGRLAQGSTHQTIYMPDIERISTPLPPVEEQGRVVARIKRALSQVDGLIQAKRRLRDLVFERFFALIDESIGELPEEVPLKWIAQVRYGLGQPPPASPDGIPVIRATNIKRGRIISDDLIRARPADIPLERAPLLREGEILVVRSGALTGDSALITPEWAGSAPGYDLRITPRSTDAVCLGFQLLGRRVLDQIDAAKARAAQPHLNAEELGSVIVRKGDSAREREISARLSRARATTDELVAALDAQINLLRDYRRVVVIHGVAGQEPLTEARSGLQPEPLARPL